VSFSELRSKALKGHSEGMLFTVLGELEKEGEVSVDWPGHHVKSKAALI
jgi:hypothetical protein